MQQQFMSNNNKAVIWKILCDNGTFNSIPESKASLVKSELDRTFERIATTITQNDQLVPLNKRVLSEMIHNVIKYNAQASGAAVIQASGAAVIQASGAAGASGANEIVMSANYNAADISQQRQKVFENDLKLKQTEFDKFNNKPAPAKIEFADKLDTPIGSEMDKILAEQIALREKQLNMVMENQDKVAASKWLQNGQTKNEIVLKIGENIKLVEPEVIIPRKKVNFAPTEETIQQATELDFMSLLKKNIPSPPLSLSLSPSYTPPSYTPLSSSPAPAPAPALQLKDIESLQAKLDEILNNQTKILNLLSK